MPRAGSDRWRRDRHTVARQKLHGDIAGQSQIDGAIDHAHATRPELFGETIVRNSAANHRTARE